MLVKLHNKKTGVTYVYESTFYWDEEKKQPRNKRKLIGKLDSVTGEIVLTDSRGGAPSGNRGEISPGLYSDADLVRLKA